MNEPETRWFLNPQQAILGFSSRYDPNSTNPQLILTVKKVEYDNNNDSYTYTIYDEKRNKYGIIVYFKASNYLSLQYVGQSCSLDFAIN